MSFHFFSRITERGERSGVSLFLSLGLGWGNAGHCMGAYAFIFSLTELEFNDTGS